MSLNSSSIELSLNGPMVTILVTGATGTHGGAVARELLSRGYTTRALVRDAQSERARDLVRAGATLVVGDLYEPESLMRAFADVDVVYAVTTPFARGAADEETQGANVIAAANEVGLPWLLLASVAAADRADVPHFVSKRNIERRLWATGTPATVIAPSYFYENVSSATRGGAPLELALPADKPLHQVALTNLGALVAAVLGRREEHLGKRVEIAADAPTPAAMAAALGVAYHELPLDEIRARSPDLAAMYAFLAGEGYAIDVRAVRDQYPEVAWMSFAEWAVSPR